MKEFVVEVWGDLACFSRPEAKVERLSYPVMTPSAARGLLDSIYCKYNEFGWRIDRIEVLRPVRYIALRRNEVKDRISARAVEQAMRGGEAPMIVADATKEMTGTDTAGRTQRQMMALRDVRYRIHAHIHPRPGFEGRLRPLEDQADRRIAGGKCFCQPCFGMKEFPAFFEFSNGELPPADETIDIGYMLYDVFDLDAVAKDTAPPFVSLFRAKLEHGVLEVPRWNSPDVLKPQARG
jgi:CRISPR-associated protein Cas5d